MFKEDMELGRLEFNKLGLLSSETQFKRNFIELDFERTPKTRCNIKERQ